MNNKLFVANIPFSVTRTAFKQLFEDFDDFRYAKLVTDRETGESRGFGFIEFDTVEGAEEALEQMNGVEVEGRHLTVKFADEKKPRRREDEQTVE